METIKSNSVRSKRDNSNDTFTWITNNCQ